MSVVRPLSCDFHPICCCKEWGSRGRTADKKTNNSDDPPAFHWRKCYLCFAKPFPKRSRGALQGSLVSFKPLMDFNGKIITVHADLKPFLCVVMVGETIRKRHAI